MITMLCYTKSKMLLTHIIFKHQVDIFKKLAQGRDPGEVGANIDRPNSTVKIPPL